MQAHAGGALMRGDAGRVGVRTLVEEIEVGAHVERFASIAAEWQRSRVRSTVAPRLWPETGAM